MNEESLHPCGDNCTCNGDISTCTCNVDVKTESDFLGLANLLSAIVELEQDMKAEDKTREIKEEQKTEQQKMEEELAATTPASSEKTRKVLKRMTGSFLVNTRKITDIVGVIPAAEVTREVIDRTDAAVDSIREYLDVVDELLDLYEFNVKNAPKKVDYGVGKVDAVASVDAGGAIRHHYKPMGTSKQGQQLFKEFIKGKSVIMDRNGWKNLDKPISGCRNIVVTSYKDVKATEGVDVYPTLYEAISSGPEPKVIIRGAHLYKEAIEQGYLDELCILQFSERLPRPDRWFPNSLSLIGSFTVAEAGGFGDQTSFQVFKRK